MTLDLTNSFTNAADPSAFVMPSAWFEEKQSIWFQDFSFGATMFESAHGNVETLGGVGLGVADVAADERIKLEAEERKKDDPASDAGLIVELGARQRAEAVRFANGTYYLNGMAISEVEMDEALAMTRAELDEIARENNWTASQRAQAERALDQAENTTGEERTEILSTAENAIPGLTDAIGQNVVEIRQRGPQSDLTHVETRDADTAQVEDVSVREQLIEAASDNSQTIEIASISRTSQSVGDNPFADTRSPAAEFNAQAAGNVQFAEAMPPQNAPTASGPSLSNG